MNWFPWLGLGFLFGVVAGACVFWLGQRFGVREQNSAELDREIAAHFGMKRRPKETDAELRERAKQAMRTDDRATLSGIERMVDEALRESVPIYVDVSEVKRMLAERWIGVAR